MVISILHFICIKLYVILYFLIATLKSLIRRKHFPHRDFTHSANKASIDDIKVMHHSKDYLIVNKSYDVLMNSNNYNVKVTVHTQVRNLVPEMANPALKHDFHYVHRLDYGTSGVLCVPTSKSACRYASIEFKERRVDKYYLAIVRGHLSHDYLQIKIGIGQDTRPEYRTVRMALEGSPYVEYVRSACTKVMVLERGICYDFPATKVLLKPLSGRRHQLRLHMNILGHTIVGDYTYSNRRDVLPFRMFLHAYRLILPSHLEHIDVQSQDPFQAQFPCNHWIPIEFVNMLNHESMKTLKEATNMKMILPITQNVNQKNKVSQVKMTDKKASMAEANHSKKRK